MTARKLTKQERRDRMEAGLDRIAAAVPNGELLLATDQPAFFETVAEILESKPGVTVTVRCAGRNLDSLEPPPEGYFYIVLEIDASDTKAKPIVDAAVKNWTIAIGPAAEVTQ